jgi:hypothetical protein
MKQKLRTRDGYKTSRMRIIKLKRKQNHGNKFIERGTGVPG